jgi:hypothetical protein
MDRDWTASFSIRFRNGTCILDKKSNIANSSCHFGSYGSIWTSEASVHIIFFCWRTGPYTAIWPSVPWTICYLFFIVGCSMIFSILRHLVLWHHAVKYMFLLHIRIKIIHLIGWTLSTWPSLFRDIDWNADIDRSKNRV